MNKFISLSMMILLLANSALGSNCPELEGKTRTLLQKKDYKTEVASQDVKIYMEKHPFPLLNEKLDFDSIHSNALGNDCIVTATIYAEDSKGSPVNKFLELTFQGGKLKALKENQQYHVAKAYIEEEEIALPPARIDCLTDKFRIIVDGRDGHTRYRSWQRNKTQKEPDLTLLNGKVEKIIQSDCVNLHVFKNNIYSYSISGDNCSNKTLVIRKDEKVILEKKCN